jgi:hypothetical protein
MTTAEALAALKRMTAWDVAPAFTEGELKDLLNRARRFDSYGVEPEGAVFAPLAVYAVGDYVLPTVSNGHYYKVTTAGTSGGADPAWPTTSGATVTSGTATFTEQGAAAWIRTYDLVWAAAEAWREKAGKASNLALYVTGQGLNSETVRRACIEQAEYYESRITASVPNVSVSDPGYYVEGLLP